MADGVESDLLSAPLDVRRVRALILDDIGSYIGELDAPGLTVEMELRRLCVAFWARFLPEAFEAVDIARMATFLHELELRPDYRAKWYDRCFLMRSAMYALTSDWHWIDRVRSNLGHENSEVRADALEAFAFVADRMDLCSDRDFWRSIRTNFETWQSHGDWCIALLATCNCTVAAKREALQLVLNTYEPDRPTREAARSLLRDGDMVNPLAGLLPKVAARALCKSSTQPAGTGGGRPCMPDARGLHERIKMHWLSRPRLALAPRDPSQGESDPRGPWCVRQEGTEADGSQARLCLVSRFGAQEKVPIAGEAAAHLRTSLANVCDVYAREPAGESATHTDVDAFIARVFSCEFEETHERGIGVVVTVQGVEDRATEVAAQYVYLSAIAGRRGRDWYLCARHTVNTESGTYDRVVYEPRGDTPRLVVFRVRHAIENKMEERSPYRIEMSNALVFGISLRLAGTYRMVYAGSEGGSTSASFDEFVRRIGECQYGNQTGDSLEHAIVIHGAADNAVGGMAEYAFLAQNCGKEGHDWDVALQMLLVKDGRRYDQLNVRMKDGTTRTFFFDITEFFGKWPGE